jgi:APA family basic amino acid/polyamine antiporter
MAEEDMNPGKNILRSLFGGAIIGMIVYVSINNALLYVLPVSAIAGSQLAVADAAEVIFGKAGYTILIVIALFSLLTILNAQMMISSRILYGLSNEGLFIKSGTLVNKGGTPYIVMIITSFIGITTISIGSFDDCCFKCIYDNCWEYYDVCTYSGFANQNRIYRDRTGMLSSIPR